MGSIPAELVEGLCCRRSEIEQAVLARAFAVARPPLDVDPDYVAGLRGAIAAAVGYALEVLERDGSDVPAPPSVLVDQAHLAARHGVSLDTVLRRYCAGQSVVSDFIVEQAAIEQLPADSLRGILSAQAAAFDGLISAVSAEHETVRASMRATPPQRKLQTVGRLLAGETLDAPELEYDFSVVHLGLLVADAAPQALCRELGRALDCRLLLVPYRDEIAWAWLGSRESIDSTRCERAAFWARSSSTSCVAIGEPAAGLHGWRLTHRQALAAFGVARRSCERCVRYAEVSLLTAALRDDLLAASLRQAFLEPLWRQRDGGVAARQTLRAYLDTGANISSTAAALGINRNTVTNRLRGVERCIGRPLDTCLAELDTALRLDGLIGDFASRRDHAVAGVGHRPNPGRSKSAH